MAGKLSARTVETIRSPGLLADGGGLYLQVTSNAQNESVRKSWVFRYRHGGRTREMGLGSLAAVPLSKAREAAAEARQIRAAGLDPIEHRHKVGRDQRLAAEQAKTFREVAEEYVAARRGGWRNAKHRAQWSSTLARYAFPAIGNMPVGDIAVADVRNILESIWTSKPVTADRVRSRIELVLDYARAMELRSGDNPARWRGLHSFWFKAPQELRPVRHHPALPYGDVPSFLRQLREQRGLAAKALEFTILTAARTGETIGARWSEIDLDAALWTVPANRMKTGRDHRVPLSPPAVKLLRELRMHLGANGYVFSLPGSRKPMSNMAMLTVIKRMGMRSRVTSHGFRSSFRDWAAEQTTVDAAVAEAALSHSTGTKVEKAYLRADRLDQRRDLMEKWSVFVSLFR